MTDETPAERSTRHMAERAALVADSAPAQHDNHGASPDISLCDHAPGYRVTIEGRVFSLSSNWRGYGEREMRQTPNADGYPSVRLTLGGKRIRLAVHRLVAKSYLPTRPSPDHQIRHIDGNKSNPHAENLAWGTAQENADDRERHGRTSRGEKHAEAIKIGQEKCRG